MRASDSSGRQTAKDYKNKHHASCNRAKLVVACGYRAHGALLQVAMSVRQVNISAET
jgi:hypothetical protein